MTRAALEQAVAAWHLYVSGVVEAPLPDPLPRGEQVVLLSPADGFWGMFQDTPEYQDGQADPMDRWSSRALSAIADEFGAEAVFPFGGPPYLPFIDLALRSNRAWQSPIGMLVHERDGLFTSYRGGLVLSNAHDWGEGAYESPCTACPAPCLNACPVGALSAEAYDVPKCAAHMDTDAGVECASGGCLARRSCPVGQGRRSSVQNAFHMAAFRGTEVIDALKTES